MGWHHSVCTQKWPQITYNNLLKLVFSWLHKTIFYLAGTHWQALPKLCLFSVSRKTQPLLSHRFPSLWFYHFQRLYEWLLQNIFLLGHLLRVARIWMKSRPHNCVEWISSSTCDTEQVEEKEMGNINRDMAALFWGYIIAWSWMQTIEGNQSTCLLICVDQIPSFKKNVRS